MFVVSHCLYMVLKPQSIIPREVVSYENEAQNQALGLPWQLAKYVLRRAVVNIKLPCSRFLLVMCGFK